MIELKEKITTKEKIKLAEAVGLPFEGGTKSALRSEGSSFACMSHFTSDEFINVSEDTA